MCVHLQKDSLYYCNKTMIYYFTWEHQDQNPEIKILHLPNVLLILGETPVGDAELELFWDRRIDLLNHLKWNVESYLLGGQLHKGNHKAIWKTRHKGKNWDGVNLNVF